MKTVIVLILCEVSSNSVPSNRGKLIYNLPNKCDGGNCSSLVDNWLDLTLRRTFILVDLIVLIDSNKFYRAF